MAEQKVQNFQNHARNVPPFHFFALPVLMINVIVSLVFLKNGINFLSIWNVLMALALVIAVLFARVFALTVQDRVIRLEMQMRMERLLPPDLKPRIGDFTVDQFVALRFACDEELPGLARQALDEKIATRKAIKSRIKNWRPDYHRA